MIGDTCPQCHGTGIEYPHGHEGDPEWEQRCGACNGTGEEGGYRS